jgi:catechol 2,3-dioxygenase-like lactoylglutathione lyase family enzyme
MERRVDLVTLRVTDLEGATRYYAEALGWEPLLAVPGEVTFFQSAPGQLLSLFDAAGFDADLQGLAEASFTLAHNVGSEAEVDAVVAEMVAAGARVLKPAQRADWGGYHALVADPAGTCWEIAHNPSLSVAPDGTVSMGAPS